MLSAEPRALDLGTKHGSPLPDDEQVTCLKPHEELQYLNLISTILAQGEKRGDRTGTGTLSLFAPAAGNFRFSLGPATPSADHTTSSAPFPLLTTKRVGLRIVFEELIWFVRGLTDGQILKDKGVTIWEGNGSREYLDSVGLQRYRERDLGPVYGFQWRHFGATYTSCDADYTGQGVDQLKQVIRSLLFNPSDRRIILSAWNPAALKDMALPPCHMFCQFYVSNIDDPEKKRTLSCQLYQRSCDIGLGVPFNIASYAMLTRMIAHVLGYEAGEFIHCMGDAHIYLDHVDALSQQVTRTPTPFPTLKITKETTIPSRIASGAAQDEIINEALALIESFEFADFAVDGYKPHAKIAMKMSV